MAKLKSDAIELKDLNEYLVSDSDFSFEMSVFRELRSQHLKCEHGGHYEDPVTKKSREFDFRAVFESGNCRVRMAIECKNIRENFPLLVSQVPRELEEAYHEFAIVVGSPDARLSHLPGQARPLRVANSRMYPPNVGVVKSTAQVGRLPDSTITANDAEIYEKWGQSLASAVDLVTRIGDEAIAGGAGLPIFTTVVPLVVVPNGRLWAVNYDTNGQQLGEPQQVDRASCYVGKSYRLSVSRPGGLTLSHLEIVTFGGLFKFIESKLRDTAFLFPGHAVERAMRANGY